MILCETLTDRPSILPAVSTILGFIFKVKPEKKSILRVLNFSFFLQTYALSGSKDNITEENFHIQNFYLAFDHGQNMVTSVIKATVSQESLFRSRGM